jgi:hypothetical protein
MTMTLDKPTMTVAELNHGIKRFAELYVKGVEAWIEAGTVLCELVDADPHVYDYILKDCPNLNAGILERFEQMGRKTLHPQLLLNNSIGYSRLQKLPYSLQERYLDEPIPLVVHTESGETDILLVKAREMTKDQANQVFANGRLRTEGEQKAWLIQQQSNKSRDIIPAQETGYKIKGKKVIINGVEFTRRQLASILAQMD